MREGVQGEGGGQAAHQREGAAQEAHGWLDQQEEICDRVRGGEGVHDQDQWVGGALHARGQQHQGVKEQQQYQGGAQRGGAVGGDGDVQQGKGRTRKQPGRRKKWKVPGNQPTIWNFMKVEGADGDNFDFSQGNKISNVVKQGKRKVTQMGGVPNASSKKPRLD